MDQPSDLPTAATTPSGAPVLPDAAPEPQSPAVIRREDYKPFAWLVPEIRLEFDLGVDTTQVQAVLKVAPNPDAEGADEIQMRRVAGYLFGFMSGKAPKGVQSS